MVDILKQVWTADWDRERLNTSVNTSASWSAQALRTQLGMLSGPAALRGFTRLNVLLTFCHGEGELKVLGSGQCRWHCVILKVGVEDVVVRDVAGFPFVICDCL